MFDPLDWPMTFEIPRRLSSTSAWIEHIPFGMALVEMLRPGVLVELGTQRGDSYLAFCQTVLKLGLPTRCTAIDTWAGDKQMPFSAEQLLGELRSAHDPLYSAFSTLLLSTFDDARLRFADGSIDLLHIDGAHDYESVRNDYESWRPKISNRGVILFHDTAVRDREDFGVWKLWAEIAGQFPSFAFEHAHGLGVLVTGAQAPPAVLDFVAWANGHADAARRLYVTLGDRITLTRVIHTILLALAEQRAGIGRWLEITQQPRPAPPPMLADAMAQPLVFIQEAMNEVEFLANDDMRLRTYIGRLSTEMEQLKQQAAALAAENQRLRAGVR